VKNVKDFFVLQPCYEQKPLSFFENMFLFARNHPRKKIGRTGKNTIFSLFGRAVLEGRVVLVGPP
jgi:hypothetical protein